MPTKHRIGATWCRCRISSSVRVTGSAHVWPQTTVSPGRTNSAKSSSSGRTITGGIRSFVLSPAMRRGVEQLPQVPVRQPDDGLQLQRVEVAHPTGPQVLQLQPWAVALVVDTHRDLGELAADHLGRGRTDHHAGAILFVTHRSSPRSRTPTSATAGPCSPS